MSRIDRLWNGSCEETRDCLSAHLEDDLEGRRKLLVRRHLARCERCRAVLLSLARAVEHLRSLGRTDFSHTPSPSVADAVVDRIRHEPR